MNATMIFTGKLACLGGALATWTCGFGAESVLADRVCFVAADLGRSRSVTTELRWKDQSICYTFSAHAGDAASVEITTITAHDGEFHAEWFLIDPDGVVSDRRMDAKGSYRISLAGPGARCKADKDCVDDNPCTFEQCVGGFCSVTTGCSTDDDCSDSLFCTGVEVCLSDGCCGEGVSPCQDENCCDELGRSCLTPAECFVDCDADGVSDDEDVCPCVPASRGVDESGRPLGDLDVDCDVDLSDFAIFQGNFTR